MIAPHIAAGRLHTRAILAASGLAAALLFWAPSAHAISVCIDPGHGGPYSNANANGLREKDVNLWISLDLKAELEASGHDVTLTRASDRAVGLNDIPTWNWDDRTGWSFASDGMTAYASGVPRDDLQARCNVANAAGVDLFISVHNNGSTSTSARGTEMHASAKDPLGMRLRVLVQREVVRETGLVDRGVWTNDFYVVRWSNMPAILVEGAFISNPSDASLLKDRRFRRRIARGIARGVDLWLAENPYRQKYPRLAGIDRHSTAASVSVAGWPSNAPAAVVTGGGAHAESLVAVPLAHQLGGPVLLTRQDALHPATAAELARLRPAQVVVVGGPDTVADSVLDEISAAAGMPRGAVRRVGGADVYETAALIAGEVGVAATGSVVLTRGDVLADALSIAPWSAQTGSPILLTHPGGMPTVTADALASLPRARTYVIGGVAAVPAEQVEGMTGVGRLAGIDRFDTNRVVLSALYGGGSTLRPYAANGRSLIDALTVAAKAGRERAPVVLTGGRTLSPYTRLWITRERPRITGFVMTGGTGAQPYLMDWMLAKADAE